MWFCYEKSITGWAPVVYHQDEPKGGTVKMNGGRVINRSQVWKVPEDCIAHGEPKFAELQKRFPPPPREDYTDAESIS